MNTTILSAQPWYRHRWPWLLMAGPFIVVIASGITFWLAVKSNDGLVTEDYYRQGLAASQTLLRSERAETLGLEAGVRIKGDRLMVRLQATDKSLAMPAMIRVTISHPTRAGLDQTRVMARGAGGYEGEIRLPAAGHWLVQIEDEPSTWRLLGNVVLPASGETLIGGGVSAGQ